MAKIIFGFIWKVMLKLIFVGITISAYLFVDNGFSVLNFLGISLSDPKQMTALDILIISTIVTVIFEAIVEFLKMIWNRLKVEKKVEVDISVTETENDGAIIYFSKGETLKDVILSYKIIGNERGKFLSFFLPLGKVQVVLPDWVTVNEKLRKNDTGHTRAIQIFEQNVEKKILNTYLEIDLKKCSNFGLLSGAKGVTIPLICEDDEYVSSNNYLVVRWDKSENWLGKHFNILKFNKFEFQYKHSEKGKA